MNKSVDATLTLLKCLWERRGYYSYHDFEKLGYSKKQFGHAIKALEDAGLIQRAWRGKYIIMMKDEWVKTIIEYYIYKMSTAEREAYFKKFIFT
ncbi:MAG: hypothetical protein QW429_04805 [Thermoprotei archaeon]